MPPFALDLYTWQCIVPDYALSHLLKTCTGGFGVGWGGGGGEWGAASLAATVTFNLL